MKDNELYSSMIEGSSLFIDGEEILNPFSNIKITKNSDEKITKMVFESDVINLELIEKMKKSFSVKIIRTIVYLYDGRKEYEEEIIKNIKLVNVKQEESFNEVTKYTLVCNVRN